MDTAVPPVDGNIGNSRGHPQSEKSPDQECWGARLCSESRMILFAGKYRSRPFLLTARGSATMESARVLDFSVSDARQGKWMSWTSPGLHITTPDQPSPRVPVDATIALIVEVRLPEALGRRRI